MKTIAVFELLTVMTAVACGQPPSPAVEDPPATKHPIQCEAPTGAPMRAEFTSGTPANAVDTIDVTFTAANPSSADANAALRACVAAAYKTLPLRYDGLATAWFNDEGPLELPDGSTALFFDPKTGETTTANERGSVKPTSTERVGYIVEGSERKVLVPPYGKFAHLEMLFDDPVPSEGEIQRILLEEVRATVQKQNPRLDTTAFAERGPRSDPNRQEQIRGSSGVYLRVEFDSKTGELRNQDGRVVGRME